jgi:hypothetical protein
MIFKNAGAVSVDNILGRGNMYMVGAAIKFLGEN